MANSQSNPPENPPDSYQPPTTADELVQRYDSGERYFWDVDIPEGADLRNVSLADAIFNRGWLTDLDMRDANLQNVNFLSCNVKCTDFRGANLSGATFKGSTLESANFENANLTGASFAGAYVYGYELQQTNGPDEFGRF